MLKNRFIKNNFIFIAGTLIGGFLGYLFNFVVSRQISVAQYGELQSLTSSFIIFGVFNSALSYFVIRHTSVFASRNDREANQEFTNYLRPKIKKFTIALLCLLIIFSILLSSLLHFSSYLGFIVISLTTFFSTMTIIYFETLRGWQKFFILSVIGVATAFAKLLSGVVLAYFSHKTSFVSFSFLFSALISWYLSKYWSEKEKIGINEPKENISSWKNKYFPETSIRKSAFNIFFFSLAIILVSNIDVLLVKYFSSADITGYFGAFNLLGKMVLWLNMTVVTVMLPGACVDGHDGKRPGKKNLLESYGLMTIIGAGSIVAFYFAPNFIVNLFFGNKYIFDTQVLWLFALIYFLLSILTLEANLSFAKRDFRVIYSLAATTLLMIAGLAKFHGSIREIAVSLTISFLIGYLATAALNISHERYRLRTTEK
jgi:O-antigen/teichoic acid export membrane protein